MRGLKLIIAFVSWLFLLPLNGQDLWNNVIITSSEDQAYATAASNIDNTVVVAGMASSDEAFASPVRPYRGGNSDGFVAKYDDSGNLIWATYLGSVEEDACGDVAVDELGNIYVTGYVESFWSTDEPELPGDHQGSSVGNDAFVCKLSPSGDVQWFHVFGGNAEDSGIALSYFRGQLYMVMNARFSSFEIDGVGPQGPVSSANRRHYALLAMNAETGSREWFWFLGSEGHDFGAGQFLFPAQEMNRIDLEVDGSGVYVGAILNGRDINLSSNEGLEIQEVNLSVDTESDPFLIKFDHKGVHQFSDLFTSSLNDHFYLKLTLDCDRVYAMINVDYEILGSDYNTWLYGLSKTDGSNVMSERYNTAFSSEYDAIVYDLESDGRGRLLAVGSLRETLSYTETTGGSGSIYSAGYNFFLLNIRASDGRVISSHEGGGNGDDGYFGISVSESFTVSLVGAGRQGDEIAGANTGNIALLNGSNNILIRSRATSVADIGGCCRKAGLIKTVSADPEYFCNGETVTLSAEGDYDEINWFIVDGTSWTPIPESGAINATANVNIYAIGILDCGIADTSEVVILIHDKTDPIFSNCPADLTVEADPGTCEYIYTFGTPVATDNCAPPTVTRTDGNGWNSGDALPIGVHTFTYSATDEGGRTAVCSYQLQVNGSIAGATITSCAPDISVVNDLGDCGAIISNLGGLVTDAICGSDSTYNDASSTFFPVGDTDVIWTYEVEPEEGYWPEPSPMTNCMDLAAYFPRMINSTGTAVRMDDYALVVNAADEILTTQVLTDQVDGTYGDNTNCNGLPCATSGTWAPALSLTRSLGNGSGGNISAGMVISTDFQAAQVDLSSSNDTLFLNDGVTLSSQSRVRLRNGAHIIVSGHVNIHCTQLVVQSNSKIELLPGASLMVFCDDYVWVNGASQIVADSPEDVFIYSVHESWYEDGAYITAYAYSEKLVEINQISLNPDTTVYLGRISAPIIEFYNHIKMIDAGDAPCLEVASGPSPEILNNNGDPYSIEVPENYDGLVLDMNGTDDINAEGSGLIWSIGGPDASWMTLDPVNGNLSFTDAPDFENPQDIDADNIYSLIIRLSDQSSNSVEINMEIKVLDISPSVSTCTQTVSVTDQDSPVPDTASLANIVEECSATVNAPTATDNCSGSITGTTTDPLNYASQGTYSITWTYDDGNGNTVQQMQTVIVDDLTAPVPDVANLPTIVEECSSTISAFPTATDACSGPTTATTSSALSYTAAGTYTITWNYTDASGNSSTQDQQVLITDTESPTISLPSGGSVSENSDTGQCGAIVTWNYPNFSDNCTLMDTLTWGPVSGDFLPVGIHYAGYQITDVSGNSTLDSLEIIVVDNEDPIVGGMGDMDVFTDLDQCGAIVNWTIPEISDNCAVVDTAIFENGNPTGPAWPGEFFPVGDRHIRIVANDAEGRDHYVQFHLNVIDGQDPVFLSFPNDTTVFTDAGECHATVLWNIPTYDDNCAVTQVNSTDDPGDLFNTGTHAVEYSIRDAEGNETLQSFTITVVDNEDPLITACPSSTAFPFDGNCELVLPDLTSSVDAEDNCTSDGDIIITQFPLPGTVITSTTTLAMTATDEAGNTSTCSLDIIFNENIAPVPDMTSLPDITGVCSAEVTTEPTATDNCAGTIVGTTTDPLVYNSQGTYTITWVYEDGNGNSSSQNQTVIVDDNTAPVPDVANLPTITEECSAAVQRPTATDNCAGTIIGQTSDPLTYTAQGTYTITWIYDDGNGNSSSQTQMVIIDDVTAPLPDNGSLPTLTAECSVTATAPTASDNCEGTIIATTTDPLTYSAQGSYWITWVYDDGNGNSSAQIQTVIILDVTAPMPDVISLPVVNGECSATAIIPTATDNCEGTITGSTSDPLTYTEQGTYTITWTYDDGNGNSSQQTQTIVVDDVTPPTPDVTSLPDVLAECSVMVLEPTASDNCEGSITGTTTDPTSFSDQGTYTITWTYDDGNGNTSVQTQTVIIDDTTAPAPVLAALPDVTGQCAATAVAPMANDNCEGMIIGATSDPLSYSTQGTFTITWTYDDGNGNTSVQTQSVIIQDTVDPVLLSTPMDIERNLDANCEYVLEDLTGLISATDACDTDLDIVQSPPAGQVFSGIGTVIALTFTVTDDAGNVLNTGFSIELMDISAPVISCPSMLTVNAAPGTCGAVVVFSDPTATDACGMATVTRTDAIALNSGDEFPVGLTTLTYQATDESGNTSNCSYGILVRDEDGPIITGPATDSPEYDEMCGVELMSYADLLTYSDGCTPFESLISSQSPAVGSVITGPTLVTVTILDGAGNGSDHDIMVTPIDVTAPVFSPMSDVSRPLAGPCQYLMEDFTGMVGVSDNCSATLTLSQSPAVNTPFFGHGTIVPVTIYAEDASGNVDSLTFNVELEDVTPPSIDCPNDTTVYSTAASCDVFIDMEVAVAYDACQTVFPINNYNGTGDASDFYGLGTTFLSWSTTDDQNFLSTCVQVVTVIDTVAPVIDEISEVVVDMFGCTYELGNLSANVMVTDNCSEAEDLSITQNPIGGQISGPTYLEFIVTDASGNSSMTGFTVVPVNVVAPVMDCYGTLSAILPEDECEVDVNVPAPSATDDCGDATVVNTINGTDELILTLGLGEQEVTWIATDAEGNSSECSITVIVTPEVPVSMTCPGNISTIATATDCGAEIEIDIPEVNGFCSFVLSNDFNGTDNASGYYEVGTSEVTFTATGSATASCSFTVEVLDITAPEMTCPAAIEQCGTEVDMDQPTLNDACGISSLVNDFNGLEDASGTYPAGETIITWTATDISGNTNTCTTVVEVTEMDIEVDAGPDAILDFTFEHHLQATLPTGATGTWSCENEDVSFSDVNDPQASVDGLALGNNVLTWTVDHGLCGVMQDEVQVLTRQYLIPTGFSPNGDNVNDRYVIRGLASLGGVAIQVFDRWGLEVYASDEYDNSWDGISPLGKMLPTGTYFYIITLKERDEILRGSLELKR